MDQGLGATVNRNGTAIEQSVAIPSIARISGVDRLLAMLGTAVDITGDAVVSCIVAKSEGESDQTVYDSP